MQKPAQLEMPGLVPPPAAAAPAPAQPAWAERMLSKAGLTAPAADTEEWIGTAEAAVILQLKNIRTVQRYCNEGRLKPGADWRKVPGKNGDDRGGNYRIRKAAVIALSLAAG